MDSLKETQPNKWVWQVLPVGFKVCVLMINYQTEDGMPSGHNNWSNKCILLKIYSLSFSLLTCSQSPSHTLKPHTTYMFKISN